MVHTITRRDFGKGAAGLAAAMSAPGQRTSDQRPNIILCMGDDHGWFETGYNGHPYLKTPVLDEMAASGLRLNRFYSAAPVCSPTRASVMTGRHPNRCGTFSANWSTRPEEITIAHVLRKAGYACGHFGKWHLGPVKKESPTSPGAMGFDEWLSHDNFFEMDPYFSRNGGPPRQFKGESSEIVINEAARFMTAAKQNRRPFFTVIWFGSPHEPYSGLEKDLALYKNLPASLKSRFVELTGEDGLPAKLSLGDVLPVRFAEITAMDRAMGQLRQYLKTEGLRQNTLLWYCGDNGTPADARLDMPLRGAKGRVYDGGIRIPGIIEWPDRIPKPRTTEVNAVTSDMLPTICDLTGQPLPKRPLDGISLKPLIDGSMKERAQPVCFWSYSAGREAKSGLQPYLDPQLQRGTTPLAKKMGDSFTRNFQNFRHPVIREQDFEGPAAILGNQYKLVVAAESAKSQELFDVRADQRETRNLIPDKAELAKDMSRQLRDWQQSVLTSLTGADYR
jgi:arylsulfatase A-like enzyme